MSYAVGTPHYNLPQTTGNDKRDWFDTNQAFLALDGDVYDAKETADSVAQDMSDVVQNVANLSTRVGTAEGDIDNLESGLATANENIGINATAISNLNTQVGDVKQDMKDAICSIEETSATAQYRHEVGTYFWYNDTLYKTTVLIPVGNTIVPNTNCETTNVTTELLNGGGGSGVEIDDTSISTGKVWSSSKTNAEIQGAVAVQAGDTRYSNGKLQYYNGTSWVDVQIGGGMVADLNNKLHDFTTGNLSFTSPVGGCFLVGSATASASGTITVGGDPLFKQADSGDTFRWTAMFNLYVPEGKVITTTSAQASLHVYAVLNL